MNTLIKILSGVVALVVLVFGAAAVYFGFFFDPNNFRDEITQLVKDRTGRDLTIEGDLALSYFPWLGVDIGPTRLSDDPAFGTEPFARFDAASVRVKLIPLFSRRLEVGKLVLTGLQANLVRNADGYGNWQALADLAGEDAQPAADAPGSSPLAGTLGGIELTGARLRYEDRATKVEYRVENLNLVTGKVVRGEPFDLRADLDVSASQPALQAAIKVSGTLRTDSETGQLDFDADDVILDARGADLGIAALNAVLADAKVSMRGDQVTFSAATLTADATGDGQPLKSFSAAMKGLDGGMAGEVLSFSAGELRAGGTALQAPMGDVEFELNGKSIDLKGDTLRVLGAAMTVRGSGDGETLGGLDGAFETGTIKVVNFARVSLPEFVVRANVKTPQAPDTLESELQGKWLTYDLDTQVLRAGPAVVAAVGVRADMDKLVVKDLLKSPQVTGSLAVAEFSARDLLARFGQTPPVTADSATLRRISLSGDLAATDNSAMFTNLRMTLDDSALRGRAGVADFSTLATRFDLDIDAIDLDRYLAPVEEDASSAKENVDAAVIPTETLRGLDVEGRLRIGQLKVAGLNSTDVNVGIKAGGGSVRVFPSSARLYGGRYSGDVRLDVTGDVPTLSMNEKLNDVQFGALSKDLFGVDQLSGTLRGSAVLTAKGASTAELGQHLNGSTDFAFLDGAYEGVDIWYEIRRAYALVKRTAPPAGGSSGRTAFSQMTGSASVQDGVVYSDNLLVKLPFLQVKGKGGTDLKDRSLGIGLEATVVASPELRGDAIGELEGYTIPFRIGGTLDAPRLADLDKTMLALVTEKLKKQALGKLGEKLGLPTGNQQDTANGEAEPAQSAEDLLKEKARDKLRGLFGKEKKKD